MDDLVEGGLVRKRPPLTPEAWNDARPCRLVLGPGIRDLLFSTRLVLSEGILGAGGELLLVLVRHGLGTATHGLQMESLVHCRRACVRSAAWHLGEGVKVNKP